MKKKKGGGGVHPWTGWRGKHKRESSSAEIYCPTLWASGCRSINPLSSTFYCEIWSQQTKKVWLCSLCSATASFACVLAHDRTWQPTLIVSVWLTLTAERCSLMRWAITAEAGASPWTPVSARLNAWTPVRGTVCHWLRHVHGLCHNNVNRITPRSSLVRRLPINRHLGDELSSLLSHNCTALFAMRDPFPQNEGRCHVDWWTPNKCFPLLFTAVKVKQGQLRFMSHNALFYISWFVWAW